MALTALNVLSITPRKEFKSKSYVFKYFTGDSPTNCHPNPDLVS